MKNKKEIWKPIVGYETRYLISNIGRVKSLPRKIRPPFGGLGIVQGKMISIFLNTNGYPTVSLSKNGTPKIYLIHRLVLETFVGPCPEGMEGCHFPDRNPTNCSVQNLLWDTHHNNQKHKLIHGTSSKGGKNPRAVLTENIVKKARFLFESKLKNCKELSEMFKVHVETIRYAVNKKTWKHLN